MRTPVVNSTLLAVTGRGSVLGTKAMVRVGITEEGLYDLELIAPSLDADGELVLRTVSSLYDEPFLDERAAVRWAEREWHVTLETGE